MAAKNLSISADDITYVSLPGSQGELSRDAATADDTIYGQEFKSLFPAIISWSLKGNAVYKGFAGYQATVKKIGTGVTFTTQACTLVSGKTYQINDVSKRIWNRNAPLTVFDNAVDRTSEVESVDFLFGKVTFKSSYTVVGPVTVSGTSYPTTSLGSIRGFTLTQSADTKDTSDYATVQANGGYKTFEPGLKTVNIELPGVYKSINGMAALLESRAEVIIEINPDGNGSGATASVARGFFRATKTSQQGNVGALEEENVSFSLSVPIQASGPILSIPFGWHHGANSPIPTAIKTCLNAWETSTLVYAKYLPDGVAGVKGQGVITNMTLSSTMEGVNTFQVDIAGSGALTTV
jgi:hypothetical protein